MSTIIKLDSVGKRFWLPMPRTPRDPGLSAQQSGAIQRWWRHVRRQRRREFWALRDVSFEVAEGESVAIVGRNGSGKSTLLKIVSQVLEPTTGRISMAGRVASLLEVGVGFHPDLTGRENVYLNGSILGLKYQEIRREFGEIVEFAELADFIDVPVKRYSSGMKVRLAFAVASTLSSDIMIIDEALAVGDVAFQRKCLERLKEQCRQGRTLLFVSHSISTVQEICRRAIVLEHGSLTVDTSVEEAAHRYLPHLAEKHVMDGTAMKCLRSVAGVCSIQNQTLQFQLELETEDRLNVDLRVRLKDEQNLPAAWVELTFPRDHFDSRSCASRFRVEVPVDSLSPGKYSISLDFRRAEDAPYETLEDCFVLAHASNRNQLTAGQAAGLGPLHLRVSRFEKAGSDDSWIESRAA